jgi:hypothetical protein
VTPAVAPVIRIRDAQELQRAHDLLSMLTRTDLPLPVEISDRDKSEMEVAVDMLCWVLHHDRAAIFNDTLLAMEEALVRAGYERIEEQGRTWMLRKG